MSTFGVHSAVATTDGEVTAPRQQFNSFASRFNRDESDGLDSHLSHHLVQSPDPALSLALLTCMDARLDIFGSLGIAVGDAHILRNAGGRVTEDVIRSLHLSVNLMQVREIGILHHTNCGLSGTDNDTLAQRTGIASIDFLPFQKFQDSLSQDIAEVLRAEILPTGGIVWGAVYSLGSEQISLVYGPTEVDNPRHAGSRRGNEVSKPS